MFCLFLFVILLWPQPTYAVSEFRVDQNINYTFADNGDATVNHQFKLINNFSQIYATNYTIELTGDNLTQITGRDQIGNIISQSSATNGITKIELKFNNPAIGKDKSTDFNLSYKIPGLAKAKGNTWEISLPEPGNLNPDDVNHIILELPAAYGNLSYSSAETETISHFSQHQQIKINQKNNYNTKVLLTFGSFQLFDFNLTYFLTNSSDQLADFQIPIPPDTNSQKIVYQDINPPFRQITSDQDGNWLLSYQLQPQQEMQIEVSGQAKISNPSGSDPEPDKNIYTSGKTYWPVSDSNITALAATLTTPRQIYDYVVGSLSYNYNGLNFAQRQGALQALLTPDKSLCTEFSDLFITLARAAGIPAREIQGFAYTNNSKIKPVNPNTDILHSWAQYYDNSQNRWISIDPTWANTTKGINYFSDLDLNHLVFVIHGQDSQQPLPPGAYKSKASKKSVDVKFASNELESQYQTPILKFINPKLAGPIILEITNPNPNQLSNLTLSSPTFKWLSQLNLLPFEKKQLTLPSPGFLTTLLPSSSKINFSLSSDQISSTSQIAYPLHYVYLLIAIIGIIIVLCLSGIILTSPRWLYHEKNN